MPWGRIAMKFLWICAAHIGVCFTSLCHAEGKPPSFNVLILHENGIHKNDAMVMKKLFSAIGKAIGAPTNIVCMRNNKVSPIKMNQWVSKIHENSTAIIYYSGSNPKNPTYNGEWPLISIDDDDDLYCHPPRLSLILVDCYNKCIDVHTLPHRPCISSVKKLKDAQSSTVIKNIWKQKQGSLLICSNRQGEHSYGMILNKKKKKAIGVFTEALLTYFAGQGKSLPIKLSELGSAVHNHILQNTRCTPTMQSSKHKTALTGDGFQVYENTELSYCARKGTIILNNVNFKDHLMGFKGTVQATNSTINSINITGTVQATNSTIDSLSVTGTIDLKNCAVNRFMRINGALSASNTDFHCGIEATSQKITLIGCNVKSGITMNGIFPEPQVIELQDNCNVWNITVNHTRKGNGEVWLYPNSIITGKVWGATVIKKEDSTTK
jgi:hypothetical protein